MKTSDLINPCESSLCDCMMISIARTFENKNQINIKITPIDLLKMDAFGKEHHSWMFAEPVFYQVLNTVQWWSV